MGCKTTGPIKLVSYKINVNLRLQLNLLLLFIINIKYFSHKINEILFNL